jgi:hypothetical protein
VRNVAQNAQGRRRMLDQEIPAAIKQALSGEDEEDSGRELSVKELLSITHSQSLEALDLLEERYRTRKVQATAETAAKKFGNVRLGDLMKRMEKKLKISNEDTALALFYEIQEIKNRLDKLEKAHAKRGPTN